MREFGKIMAAFAGGALVGAVVALLTAPKSGAETRAQIIALAKEKGLHLRAGLQHEDLGTQSNGAEQREEQYECASCLHSRIRLVEPVDGVVEQLE